MSGNEGLISALYELYEDVLNDDYIDELSRYIKELKCTRRACGSPAEKDDIERDIASLKQLLRIAKEQPFGWGSYSPLGNDLYCRLPRSVLCSSKCLRVLIDDAEQGRAFDIDDIIELAGQRWAKMGHIFV